VSRLSHSTVLIDRFDEIDSRFASLELDLDVERRRECVIMVLNNWPEIVAQLWCGGFRCRLLASASVNCVPICHGTGASRVAGDIVYRL
jgi:hypothetical protein